MTLLPMDENDEFDKHFAYVIDLATKIRGPFINYVIDIERIINDIIANFFCSNESRRRLFFSSVLNGSELSFSQKTRILKAAIEYDYPEIYQAYPKLFDQLDKIRRFRNRLAHAMLDTTEDFLNKRVKDRIQLTYFEDGQTKQQVVTQSEIKKRLAECSQVLLKLVDIQSKVSAEAS